MNALSFIKISARLRKQLGRLVTGPRRLQSMSLTCRLPKQREYLQTQLSDSLPRVAQLPQEFIVSVVLYVVEDVPVPR